MPSVTDRDAHIVAINALRSRLLQRLPYLTGRISGGSAQTHLSAVSLRNAISALEPIEALADEVGRIRDEIVEHLEAIKEANPELVASVLQATPSTPVA